MSETPIVSFIVCSYNYERYIAKTLQSILDQTVPAVEVIVVDDASIDGSREVVRTFNDPRVRLYVNERNTGATFTYNRAAALARGTFLVTLDADDWIAPQKTEAQLAAFARDGSLDILGTYVHVVDEHGKPHPRAPEYESLINQPFELDRAATWIVQNLLCHSSVMLRRSVHERYGPAELAMARAPDFERWTRALRHGCHLGLLQERLTFYRMHSFGATHGDPRATFLEISYLLLKNLLPLLETRADWGSLARALGWITSHEEFARLLPAERYRLLGLFLASPSLEGYTEFHGALSSDDPALLRAGRRLLAVSRAGPRPIDDPRPDEAWTHDVEIYNRLARPTSP